MDIAQLHFLVAEADPLQRGALLAMLAHLGATRVTAVNDGDAALAAFEAGAVDIGILDLELPGVDGLDLIRRLSEASCRAGIIVLGAQNASVLFSVETMALAYGVDMLGTIAKPAGWQTLGALIANYLPPEASALSQPPQRFTFAQVGLGLQARQFEPFFQPKIELATGQVKGLEMFARWLHPQHGTLGPSSFIDALQQQDRLDFLDWSMIEKSVAACRLLHDQNIPISIAINVAPHTLVQPPFMAQIAACLERHRIMPDYITFEIPESAVLSSEPHFLERLLRLRMQGFGLAIDDYGTARSNLQLLARIPFTELKIDRSFVDGASKKRALGTVLSSCLGLARSLDRRSVAVGVETREDWDFLQNLGCTYAQGYYIAKPMPVEEFPAWLADWRQFF
ncbi:EAL domain-containing response regulator [Janthinobacterium agaricidamnosum]|uniref:Response regulator n=1 Tax=Janthinobacterium agaricidamnosum NBRC 102515 = DSM 9628 TaxID=1349767 RepID=W0V738_9BURK|nr:EAL domain-containing response regulator [Janthinobacterium agaricidamnosum]CDG83415.1 response regulator [Janthinobacterium agaricidamnosum NBRC 102515 = DSM 9628]